MFKTLKNWVSKVVEYVKTLVKKVVGYFTQPEQSTVEAEDVEVVEETESTSKKKATGVILLETTYVAEVDAATEEDITTYTDRVLKLTTQWIEPPPRKPPRPAFYKLVNLKQT